MKRSLGIVFVLTLVVCMAWAQAPQGAPAAARAWGRAGQAPRGRRRRGGRAALPPRIVTFEASSTSLKPGESFVLTWVTEAGAATIDNGIGDVYPRGTFKVTPKATSTYTLSMGGGAVTKAVTVTVAGTTPVTAAAASAVGTKPIARIDGKPDFSGIYGFTGMAGFGARGARGGDAPAQPASPFANLPTTPTLKPGVQNRAVSESRRRNSRLSAASGRHGVWRALSVSDHPKQKLRPHPQ